MGSPYPQSQLFAGFLVDDQCPRAGIHQGVDRELPDLILGYITTVRYFFISRIYQGNFRSYYAHIVLLIASIPQTGKREQGRKKKEKLGMRN
jgi:hypothetical protein